MIFYFSGTGNSLYIAKRMHEIEDKEIIDMASALNKKEFKYSVADDEKIGIIFPVYFWGLPTIVNDFISQLRIESNKTPFIYTVITCGSSIGNANKILENLLKEKKLQLNSVFSIEMPSNYIMRYNTPNEEDQKSIFQTGEKQIEKIIKRLETSQSGDFSKHHGPLDLFTPVAYKLYGFYRKTKDFYTTDACNSCGICEEICPSKNICLEAGNPKWIKEKCSHCTACINRCPSQNIQYGNSTKNRRRYINPNVNFDV